MSNRESTNTILSVGASEEANIVINQPTVSRLHCRFEWNGNAWILHDLNSTNGTFVNGVRIAQPTVVRTTDQVTLGRGVACAVPQPLITASTATPTVTLHKDSANLNLATARSKEHRKFPFAIGGAVTAVLLLVLGISVIISKSTESNDESKTEHTEQNSVRKENTATRATEAEPEITPALDPQGALWAAVVESADGGSQRLIGTAIAVQSNKLVTLASLVDAAEVVKDEFPRLRLVNTLDPKLSIIPSALRRHPNYSKAMEAFAAMEADLNEKLKSVNSLEEPTLEDKLKWSERFETVMEAISNSDLAILESPQAIAITLPVATLTAAQECKLIGFPLIHPSPQITSNLKAFSLELVGQANADQDLAGRSYQVETLGIAAVSSVSLACLSNNNKLLGIVSRQSTPEASTMRKLSKVIPIKLFE